MKPISLLPELIPLGKGKILVTSLDFSAGYREGYKQFKANHDGKTFTEIELLSIILDHLSGITHSCEYKIGLVTGWYDAMFGYEQHATGEHHE